MKNFSNFSFYYVDESDIEKETVNLSNSKASQDPDIPLKINNNNLDIFKKILTQKLNRSIEESRFPNFAKVAKLSQY